jgi:hypothetical protein
MTAAHEAKPSALVTFAAAFDEGDGLLFDIVKYVGASGGEVR